MRKPCSPSITSSCAPLTGVTSSARPDDAASSSATGNASYAVGKTNASAAA
jgi:hypothetical protein